MCTYYAICYFTCRAPFHINALTILTASEVDASALILVRILELEILPSLSTLNIVKHVAVHKLR